MYNYNVWVHSSVNDLEDLGFALIYFSDRLFNFPAMFFFLLPLFLI